MFLCKEKDKSKGQISDWKTGESRSFPECRQLVPHLFPVPTTTQSHLFSNLYQGHMLYVIITWCLTPRGPNLKWREAILTLGELMG